MVIYQIFKLNIFKNVLFYDSMQYVNGKNKDPLAVFKNIPAIWYSTCISRVYQQQHTDIGFTKCTTDVLCLILGHSLCSSTRWSSYSTPASANVYRTTSAQPLPWKQVSLNLVGILKAREGIAGIYSLIKETIKETKYDVINFVS